MKHVFTILFIALCSAAKVLATDSTTQVTLTCFTVNNERHYLVSGCNPGSDVDFYSQPGGGKKLRTATTDSTGSLAIVSDSTFIPAFVLSRTRANSSSKKGNGMVAFRQDVEFNLQDMSIAHNGNNTEIYWKGQVFNDAVVGYEVVMSKAGVNSVVGTYKGNTSGQYYSYAGTYEAGATYTINVLNTIKGLRYQQPLTTEGRSKGNIRVYPTAATTTINIVIPADVDANLYHIADMQGRIVGNGTLQKGKNNISIGHLTPGSYLVFTPNSIPVKIVKE